MSATLQPRGIRRRSGRAAASVAAWARSTPVAAFLVSRCLVAAAGAAGVLALTKHAAPSTVAAMRALGPVGYLLSGSVDRFDSGYYLGIAAHGYGPLKSGRIAFLPVYPALIRLVSFVCVEPLLAGVLISAGAFLVALQLLHRLTELELGGSAADATVLLLAFAPLSFFFTAVYTESLFLALSVGAFYAGRRGHWRLACALAAVATLTRPTGVMLAAALFVMRVRNRRALDRGLLWLGLVPLALVGWAAVLAHLGYGWTGQFHIEHTLWTRMTTTPVQGLVLALLAMADGAHYVLAGGTIYHPSVEGPFRALAEDVILGGVLIICLVALEACRRRMRPEYFTYAGLVILMCLATPEKGEPLWCFDRFALTIFPLWMAAGAWLSRRRLTIAVVALCAVALVFYTMQFASWSFVA